MISCIVILLTSFFFMGIVIRTKSYMSGRRGPGILQPMKDIIRLLKKGRVVSNTSSFIFNIAPSISFATILMAICFVPFGKERGLISFEGDFVFFAYILALGKFFTIILAMDTGSSFEGMGASREALYSLLAEPAFFILMGSFSLFTGSTSFYDIFTALYFESYIPYVLGILATFVLMTLAMIENSRMPIDDPKTHLELTMIHEVMILDSSGFDLGLLLFTNFLRFALYGALIANFFITPFETREAIVLFFAIQIVFAILVGFFESFRARLRLSHNAQFIFTLTSISLMIFFGVLMIRGKFM